MSRNNLYSTGQKEGQGSISLLERSDSGQQNRPAIKAAETPFSTAAELVSRPVAGDRARVARVESAGSQAPGFGLTDLLMVLTTMVWGANVSVIKVSFAELSPHAFNLARFLFRP